MLQGLAQGYRKKALMSGLKNYGNKFFGAFFIIDIGLTEIITVFLFFNFCGGHEAPRAEKDQKRTGPGYVLEKCSPGQKQEGTVHGVANIMIDPRCYKLCCVFKSEIFNLAVGSSRASSVF